MRLIINIGVYFLCHLYIYLIEKYISTLNIYNIILNSYVGISRKLKEIAYPANKWYEVEGKRRAGVKTN